MKSLWKFTRICTMALMCVLFLGFGIKAEAAPGQVTGVKQTDAGTSSVDITFNALLDNNARYEIQISSSATGTFSKWTTCSSGSAYIYGLPNAGSSYYVRVVAYYSVNGETEYGTPSPAVEVVTSPNAELQNLKHLKSTETSISLSWDKSAGANCYQVQYKKSGTDNGKTVYVSSNNVTLSKLSKNEEYTVYVRPVRKSVTGFYAVRSSYAYLSNVPVVPGKAKAPSCEYYWQNLNEIRTDAVSVNASEGFKWEIWSAYQSKDKKLKTVIQSSDAAFIKYSGFKKNNFFKMRVRSYSTNSAGKKMYGKWSNWTYFCPQPEVIRLKPVKNGMSVKWDTIKGADKYAVYVSTKQNSGYKKYTTTSKTSTTVKKYGKTALKSGKRYYFYVVAYNKVGKKLYSGMAANGNSCWSQIYKK